MGYFARRGCPIYTIEMLDRATDLDVLAMKYVEPFRRQVLITECKDTVGGALDRVFWLSGVKGLVGAHEALLVRKGTKWNIKDFAKSAGVQILDFSRIEELESTYRITPGDWPGISDRTFISKNLDAWNESLSRNQNWWELYWTVLSEIRYEEPFPAVNFLLYQLRLLTKSRKAFPPNSFERKLLADGISQLSLFMMRIAEQCFDLPLQDRTGFIEKGLKYGNVEPRYAERILNSAYNLTLQTILHYTNKDYDVDRRIFQIPRPPGTDEVLGIIELILGGYPASLNLPQICDLLLQEVFVKENRARGWLRRIFPNSDLQIRVEIVRGFLRLLVRAGACPPEVPESLTHSATENGSQKPVQGSRAEVKADVQDDASAGPSTGDSRSNSATGRPDERDRDAMQVPKGSDDKFELKPPESPSTKKP